MIDDVCSVSTSPKVRGGYRTFTFTSQFPAELRLLARPPYDKQIVRPVSCPCCQRGAVSLLANWVYSGPQAILIDSPVTYCIGTERLLLSEGEEQQLAWRLRAMEDDYMVPLQPRSVGVGNQVSRPVLSDSVREVLGISRSAPAYYSSEANAIKSGHSPITVDTHLPDAIAFHSNDIPKEITLKIEPTTRCNFRCEFCYGRYIEQGSLSLQDFLVIIDRVPNIKAVEITGEGEPLVNRHIFDMLESCAARGLWTHITSNGSLFTEQTCARLLSTGLSSLAISLESIEPEQFARLRPGGRLETVLDAVRTVARLREGRAQPLELGLWVTILRETLAQVEQIEEFAKEAGIDYVQFQTLNPMSSYTRFYSDELKMNLLRLEDIEILIRAPDTSPALRSALTSAAAVYKGKRCDIFSHTAMVYWQGNVTPCCLLKTPHFPAYGNLVAESFEEVWNREEYRFFRFALQHGIVLRSCGECPDVASA